MASGTGTTASIQPLCSGGAYTSLRGPPATLPMRLPKTLNLLLCLPALAAVPLAAQDRVVVAENVRLDYARVLSVEPVYQTLRATRTEEQCDDEPAPAPSAKEEPAKEEEGAISRMVDSVKGLFGKQEPAPAGPVTPRRNCRIVEVGREFRRPIAYDVDYIYKGTKYRSRLAEDPGNRLRIRVSVMPYLPDQPAPPANRP